MNEKEAFALVEKLLQKTADRKITWEPTADEHTFITTIKGNTFHIISSEDEWRASHTALEMVNEAGRTIWRLHEGGLDMDSIEKLRELYDSAQRIGDRVDESLSEALESLDAL